MRVAYAMDVVMKSGPVFTLQKLRYFMEVVHAGSEILFGRLLGPCFDRIG